MVSEKFDEWDNGRVYLEKLTFNSRLDNLRRHVVHGECT